MRIIDLSLAIDDSMRGVAMTPARQLEIDGWNATTLELYSHCGTHMDAPRHFVSDGNTLDQQDLSVCCGPARVVDLAPAQPRQLITIEDIAGAIGDVYPGDRLLLRTDWHQRYGTPEYRDELPRISIELARWLVEKEVALIGVEPPSVADVNNIHELTEVHQTLFRGGVLIVEGLAYLDQLTQPEVEFTALPLRIVGGDGCPVRAIAVEQDLGGLDLGRQGVGHDGATS
jgi:kynurenine formamidase